MRVEVDILASQPAQLAIAATSEESRPHHLPEILRATIDQPPALIRGEIPDDRGIDFLIRLYSAPRVVGCDTTFMERVVQRGFEHRQYPIGGGATCTHLVLINWGDSLRFLNGGKLGGPEPARCGCQTVVPV